MELSWWIISLIAVVTLISTVRCQPPQIVEDILPEVKRKGDTGYLNCTVSRLQSYKVIWIQPVDNWISENTEILAKNEILNGKVKYEIIRKDRGNDRQTFTLVINRLREEDGGNYVCTVNLAGQNRREWPIKYGNVTVQVPPTIIVSQTSNLEEKSQGDSVSLRCNATGTPNPNIRWIRANGKALPDRRLSHTGHVLNITNLRVEDRGVYRCTADNNVIPPARHDVKLIVFLRPVAQAVQSSVGQVQNRGFDAILECRIRGIPDPVLRWYHMRKQGRQQGGTQRVVRELLIDDQKYDINQLLTHRTSLQLDEVWFSLKILNVQANDYGSYFCEGKNDLGKSEAEIVLYDTNECQGPNCPSIGIANIPPTIIVSRNQGDSVSLRCNATGTPNPNIRWIRANGKALPDRRLSHTGHVLNITNLRVEDRGVYRCTADNNVIPPARHDVQLIVFFRPVAQAVQSSVGQVQNRSFDAILECRIRGIPDPVLRWYRMLKQGRQQGGTQQVVRELLGDDQKYDINQLLTHGTSLQLDEFWFSLKILNVQANDYGSYFCEGKNDLGRSEAEIVLYETTTCKGDNCTGGSSSLRLGCLLLVLTLFLSICSMS